MQRQNAQQVCLTNADENMVNVRRLVISLVIDT